MPKTSRSATAFEPSVALMAEAIDALRKLPEERQDELAPFLIALAADETVGDLDWAKPYIAEAESDIQAGRVIPLDKHAKQLKKFGLRKQTPDTFLADLYDKLPDLIIGSHANARRNLSKTRVSASAFIDILANQKLAELASKMRKHRSVL